MISSESKKPCFVEKIEAWDLGPVVPEAYHESYFNFDEENIWNSERVEYKGTVIEEKDCLLIDQVVDKFADYAAADLVWLTHRQAPWKEAYTPKKNNEITIEAIRRYFNE